MNFDDNLLYVFWLIIQKELQDLSDTAITKHLPFLFTYLCQKFSVSIKSKQKNDE